MTNEDRYRLRQLCMAWTKNTARADACNEAEMAFLALGALDALESLRSAISRAAKEAKSEERFGELVTEYVLPLMPDVN